MLLMLIVTIIICHVTYAYSSLIIYYMFIHSMNTMSSITCLCATQMPCHLLHNYSDTNVISSIICLSVIRMLCHPLHVYCYMNVISFVTCLSITLMSYHLLHSMNTMSPYSITCHLLHDYMLHAMNATS